MDRRSWRHNLKNFKNAPAPKISESELSTGDKLDELIKELEDLEIMFDAHQEIEKENPLQARLIENGALELAKEFEELAHSFTDEDFAEIRAALEEFPIKDLDSDIK